MSFFSALRDAVADASESAHGVRLKAEFDDSVRSLARMDKAISDEAIRQFIEKRAAIVVKMANWTRVGKLTVAASTRTEARRVTDLNLTEGYALWMTSAWLECSMRTSADSRHVFEQLDGLARAHETAIKHEVVLERQRRAKADAVTRAAAALALIEKNEQKRALQDTVKEALSDHDAFRALTEGSDISFTCEAISLVLSASIAKNENGEWDLSEISTFTGDALLHFCIGVAFVIGDIKPRTSIPAQLAIVGRFLIMQGLHYAFVVYTMRSTIAGYPSDYNSDASRRLQAEVRRGVDAMWKYHQGDHSALIVSL